jgi:phage terminase small subunit
MRSAKSVELSTKNFTKDEYRNRKNTQDKLKGNADKIEPSNRLNANQKKLFRYIVSELENSKVLGNLDTFMLEMGVIAIDRLQVIEKSINQDFDMIYNKELMQAKSKYTTDFFKFINEACLSPQSRAKMGVFASNKAIEDADPLLKVLKNKSG